MLSEKAVSVWSDDELCAIKNEDRILPCQPYFSKMYEGKDFYGDLQRVMSLVSPPDPEWKIKTKEGITYAVLGSELNVLRFYQFLIRMNGYRFALELGSYIGVSAMYMAAAGAEVTTVEKGEEFFYLASRNARCNEFSSKIHVIHRDALDFLKASLRWYDFIFIDCAKESYKELLELSLCRLSPNGLILVDDVFFQGDVLNENPASEKGAGVRRMLDYAATLTGYEKVILPLGNGLLMIRRIFS